MPSHTIRVLFFFALYMGLISYALPPTVLSLNRLVYHLYAAFLFWILWPSVTEDISTSKHFNISKYQQRLFWGLLLFSGLFLVATRAYPFLRYGSAPLGYDTGFYLQYFALLKSLKHIGTAVSSHLAYTPWFPLSLLGAPALLSLNILHLFHQLALAASVYFLARSLPKRIQSFPLVVAVLLLFALSINQYMTFWWMFYKQSMALPMLLAATGLYLRGHWLAIPLASAGAAVHLQSATPFAIGFVFSLAIHAFLSWRRREPFGRDLAIIGGSALLGGILLLLLKDIQDLRGYLEYFQTLKGLASNAPQWEVAQAKGLFIPPSTFRLNLLFPLPFALLGALSFPHWLTCGRTTRMLLLPGILLASLLLTSFPLVYQNRSLIILDLILIIFSCYPLSLFLTRFTRDRVSAAALGVLLAAATLSSGLLVSHHPPQLFADEREELESVVSRIRPQDYAMATTSLYTPWVFAFTNFKETIAPGWLYWDKWDLGMWQQFWVGASNEQRRALLSVYRPADIYMFFGSRQVNHPALQKFIEQDPRVTRVSPHIWKYSTTSNE